MISRNQLYSRAGYVAAVYFSKGLVAIRGLSGSLQELYSFLRIRGEILIWGLLNHDAKGIGIKVYFGFFIFTLTVFIIEGD